MPDAGSAFLIVIRQKQFDLKTLLFTHLTGAGEHFHAFQNRSVAGRGYARLLLTFTTDFDKTHTTCTRGMVYIRQLTQSRNVMSISTGHLKDGFIRFKRDFFAIDICMHDRLAFAGARRNLREWGIQ